MDANDRTGVEENGWLEDVRRVYNSERECTNRDDLSDPNSLLIPCSSESAHSAEFDRSRSGCNLLWNEPLNERSYREIFPVFSPDTGIC